MMRRGCPIPRVSGVITILKTRRWLVLKSLLLLAVGYLVFRFVRHITLPFRKPKGYKSVLQWTNYFAFPHWITDDLFKDCPVSACVATADQRALEDSDVVVFHARNLHAGALPGTKWSHQRWLLFNLEPPYFSGIIPDRYNNLFNWIMTYRQDSDFVINYGQFERLKPGEKGTPVDLKTKTELAMVAISNCHATNRRIDYVWELKRYMPVEFYGYCGGKNRREDPVHFSKYKFYLSFENGHCLDYITEKFWNPLRLWQAVPVVMGGATSRDYERVAPPGSYINTADFGSPKELAEFLLKLDKDDQRYLKYHSWREEYRVTPCSPIGAKFWLPRMPAHPGWCELCAALHNGSAPRKAYSNLTEWYARDTCPPQLPNIYCTAWNRCCKRGGDGDMYFC